MSSVDSKTFNYSKTIRENEIINNTIGISKSDRVPIKSLMKVGIGEYAASEKNKYERAKFYVKRISATEIDSDYDYIHRNLRHKDRYEKLGLELGLFFGFITYFLPGIRRLPFYLRIPCSLLSLSICIRWGKLNGLDLTNMRLNPVVETIEREYGIRNFQTSD